MFLEHDVFVGPYKSVARHGVIQNRYRSEHRVPPIQRVIPAKAGISVFGQGLQTVASSFSEPSSPPIGTPAKAGAHPEVPKAMRPSTAKAARVQGTWRQTRPRAANHASPKIPKNIGKMVPPAGLEPARLATEDFESSASTIPPEGHGVGS